MSESENIERGGGVIVSGSVGIAAGSAPALFAASASEIVAPRSRNLDAARAAKNDEFYTRITDIEKEMLHYKDHFRGKVVFCNCDDPDRSAFYRYFGLKEREGKQQGNFAALGLARVIATHYDTAEPTYKLECDGEGEKKTDLRGNGDFRSSECVALLKEADIVVTNPPFSLFREYIAQLMEHGKKFLVIGNMNAVFYKEIRPLILDGSVWLGRHTGMEFEEPGSSAVVKMGFSCWFTNLKHDRRNEGLTMTSRYEDDPARYPKYDNYDAIEVGRVKDIPKDYFGKMGVPISFLVKHNPDQFDIVGFNRDVLTSGGGMDFHVNGKMKYARLVIRRKGGQ